MNTSFICQYFGKNTQFSIGEENSGFSLMLVANIKIWKSHLNTREGSDYLLLSLETPNGVQSVA